MKANLKNIAYILVTIGVFIAIIQQVLIDFYHTYLSLQYVAILLGLLALISYGIHVGREKNTGKKLTDELISPIKPASDKSFLDTLKRIIFDVRVQAFAISIVIIIVSTIVTLSASRNGIITSAEEDFISTIMGFAMIPIISILLLVLDKREKSNSKKASK